MDLQKFFTEVISALRKANSDCTQMTLGKLIEELEKYPLETKIQQLSNPHSYRGYYEDLAFQLSENKATVKETLTLLKSCLNTEFQGYKGGDFIMTNETLIWVATYGSCGERIMDIFSNNGELEFTIKED